jgi:Zn-dependent protease with chaperone function
MATAAIFGYGSFRDLLFVILALIVGSLLRVIVVLLGLAFSRCREFLADVAAIKFTDPSYARDLLEGMIEVAKEMRPKSFSLSSVLQRSSFWMFQSHPSTEERAGVLGRKLKINDLTNLAIVT